MNFESFDHKNYEFLKVVVIPSYEFLKVLIL